LKHQNTFNACFCPVAERSKSLPRKQGEETRAAILRAEDDAAITLLIRRIADDSARDLVQNLLRKDYRKRMSVLKALLHPYFGVDCSQFPVDRIPPL
jgi:serine/threonine protein kinase